VHNCSAGLPQASQATRAQGSFVKKRENDSRVFVALRVFALAVLVIVLSLGGTIGGLAAANIAGDQQNTHSRSARRSTHPGMLENSTHQGPTHGDQGPTQLPTCLMFPDSRVREEG
jgi:hypothetical protein